MIEIPCALCKKKIDVHELEPIQVEIGYVHVQLLICKEDAAGFKKEAIAKAKSMQQRYGWKL